jgi:hypothetical protein
MKTLFLPVSVCMLTRAYRVCLNCI